MKIAIVTEYYYPTLGGIQEHVHHFAVAARRLGHDVRILTPAVGDRLASPPKPGDPAKDLDLNQDAQDGVIRIGRSFPFLSGGSLARASFAFGLSRRLKEILRSECFDIMHLHSPLMPTLPLAALRLSDTVNVGTFHSDIGRSLLLGALSPLLQHLVEKLRHRRAVQVAGPANNRQHYGVAAGVDKENRSRVTSHGNRKIGI